MKFILIGIFVWGTLIATAQNQQNFARQRHVERFDTSTAKGYQVLLRTPYDKPQILNKLSAEKLRNVDILRVELYYTKFQRSEKFNQGKLNQARWNELEKLIPGTIGSDAIAFIETGQTAVGSLEAGRQMFHGFQITYRPGTDSLAYKIEMGKLKAFLNLIGDKHPNGASTSNSPKKKNSNVGDKNNGPSVVTKFVGGEPAFKAFFAEKLKYPTDFQKKQCDGLINLKFRIDTSGKVTLVEVAKGISSLCDEFAKKAVAEMPNWVPGKMSGKPAVTNFMLPIRFSPDKKSAIVGDLIRNDTYAPYSNSFIDKSTNPSFGFERLDAAAESVVTATLNNNTWKNSALVVDVTASMTPFLAQTLKWLDKNISKGTFLQAYFFNDGDGKSEKLKTIGSTGGIYQSPCKNINEVKETLLKACNDGGDLAENNIEALLEAQKNCPDCKSLVMLADNMATPRDMVLLPGVKLPVHIILCGGRFAVNVNYLEIARSTSGSVHTLNGESPDMQKLKDGEEFKIGLFTFQYKGGKFLKTFK